MRCALLALPLALSLSSFGQTGPGGIGSSTNNVLWLDAGYGIHRNGSSVISWQDRSGRGNNAHTTGSAARPLYVANSVNGLPSIDFDGTDDCFQIPNSSSLNLTSWTMFIVVSLDVQKDFNGWLAKGSDGSENYEMLSYSDGNIHVPILWTDNSRTAPSSAGGMVSVGTFDVFEYTYRSSAGRRVYKNNTLIHSDSENKTPRTNNGQLYIGNEAGTTGRFVNGDIAEVIIYNAPLNTVQRMVVNNYLAGKYGRALGGSDLYRQDETARGDFDYDIAGIGRVDATNMWVDSRGSGNVEIWNASNLGDNEYLFWGHNNGQLGVWGVSDRPVGVQGRWGRVWRLNEVNASGNAVDVGSVTMSFDLTGLGNVTASDLRLLVDTDNDGIFSDEVPITGAVSVGSNKYNFTSVTALVNDRRFTLGTISIGQTPLPVELLSFTATAAAPHTVDLDWATATEQNSADFTVERSTATVDWKDIATVEAAGQSLSLIRYNTVDREAPAGTCYYRLRQRDIDGTTTLSDVAAVHVEGNVGAVPTVYPDPASGTLIVRLPAAYAAPVEYTLISMQGQVLLTEVRSSSEGAEHRIEPGPLAAGLYRLRIHSGDQVHVLGVSLVH